MTELPPDTYRDRRRHGARVDAPEGSSQAASVLMAVIPAGAVALLAAGVVAALSVGKLSPGDKRLTLIIGAVAAAAVLGGAAWVAAAASARESRRLRALRSASADGRQDLQVLAGSIYRGGRPALRDPAPVAGQASDPLSLLGEELAAERQEAKVALVRVAGYRPGAADARVEVFAGLARRMQSLLHREIGLLDDMEGRVEEPALLKDLFTIDHYATRLRRQTESLAVVGGAVSRRHWTRPVPMHEVLRAAAAEVEHYSRVKIVAPVPGTLQPGAVADVIHLVAELAENATKFSPPQTLTHLRAEEVAAGLAIEVEDRGLGMQADERKRVNSLLAEPSRVDVSDLLADGRIGLFVVSTLARRHGIAVQLQRNIFGGTQAIVILPRGLADAVPTTRQLAQSAAVTAPVAGAGDRAADSRTANGDRANPHRGAHPMTPAGVPPVSDALAPPLAAPGAPPLAPPPSAPPPSAGRPGPFVPAPAAAGQQAALGSRPPLPKRGTGSHMAPQLHRPEPATSQDTPAVDHMPGLMADFRAGATRAEEEADASEPGPGSS
ncbi:MAG TPA: ATP-binding protein [Streptosporangiaceae bacterium]|nr:ATP-binding protein [Streptosporangiaceae bacterium]